MFQQRPLLFTCMTHQEHRISLFQMSSPLPRASADCGRRWTSTYSWKGTSTRTEERLTGSAGPPAGAAAGPAYLSCRSGCSPCSASPCGSRSLGAGWTWSTAAGTSGTQKPPPSVSRNAPGPQRASLEQDRGRRTGKVLPRTTEGPDRQQESNTDQGNRVGG